MAQLIVEDLIEELSAENKRLLNELKSSEKCIKLLESYRKCLLTLSANCNCNPMVNNSVMITILESEYKAIFSANTDGSNQSEAVQTNKANEDSLQIDFTDSEDMAEDTDEAPESDDMQVRAEEVQESAVSIPLITQGLPVKVVTNNNKTRDQPFSQKTYRIIIRKKDQTKNKPGSRSDHGYHKKDERCYGKKLFKCQVNGCPKTYNSLRRLNTHHEWHNRTVAESGQQSTTNKPKRSENHNENERLRRQKSATLFSALLEEMPHLHDRHKRPPNREILSEAEAHIEQLDKQYEYLMNEQIKENKRQELLQKSLKGALKQLARLT